MSVIYKLKGPEDVEWSFSPEVGPIDDTTGVTNELFETLGRAAASWARMEFLLDSILLHINKKEASEELYDEKHSRSFKQSIALLRKWTDYKALVGQKEMIQRVLAVAEKLADNRNDFMHGHFKSFDERTQTFRLQRMKFEGKDTFYMSEVIYKMKDLLLFLELCEDTKGFLMKIADAVFNKPAEKQEAAQAK